MIALLISGVYIGATFLIETSNGVEIGDVKKTQLVLFLLD